MSEITLPVDLTSAVVHMKPKHVRRNMMNGGRTGRAAVRLALYQLNQKIKHDGLVTVGDLSVNHGWQGNAMDVYAETCTIVNPYDFDFQMKLAPGTRQVTFLVPDGPESCGT